VAYRPILCNNRETNNRARVVARQHNLNRKHLNYDKGAVGNGVFYAVRAKGLYNGDTSRVVS
jgi:hypothetical protein